MTSPDVTVAERPWHEKFSKPQSQPAKIGRAQVRDLLVNGKLPGKDFVLVDVRRNDHEGGTIRGSLNLPAQSFPYSVSTLYNMCEASGACCAIFYCGSSNGRGPRSASFFQDECDKRQSEKVKALILEGGIKGWVAAGKEYQDLMDGFDATAWNSS